jgi:hypothetical protein
MQKLSIALLALETKTMAKTATPSPPKKKSEDEMRSKNWT